MKNHNLLDFSVIKGEEIEKIILGNIRTVIQKVRTAYLAHGAQKCVERIHSILRIRNDRNERIISLAA